MSRAIKILKKFKGFPLNFFNVDFLGNVVFINPGKTLKSTRFLDRKTMPSTFFYIHFKVEYLENDFLTGLVLSTIM